jgi:hypothetical protein
LDFAFSLVAAALCRRVLVWAISQTKRPDVTGGYNLYSFREFLSAVAPDCFDRAAFHCLFAKRFFVGIFRLLIDKGMAAVIIALKICGRGLAAQIAVDALIINVEFSFYALWIFIRGVGHILATKSVVQG